jgi:calcium permeable stress-gated cation channel
MMANAEANTRVSLEQPWIYKDPPPPVPDSELGDELEFDVRGGEREYESQPERNRETSNRAPVSRTSSSSVSLGDTHIWRDS